MELPISSNDDGLDTVAAVNADLNAVGDDLAANKMHELIGKTKESDSGGRRQVAW